MPNSVYDESSNKYYICPECDRVFKITDASPYDGPLYKCDTCGSTYVYEHRAYYCCREV